MLSEQLLRLVVSPNAIHNSAVVVGHDALPVTLAILPVTHVVLAVCVCVSAMACLLSRIKEKERERKHRKCVSKDQTYTNVPGPGAAETYVHAIAWGHIHRE